MKYSTKWIMFGFMFILISCVSLTINLNFPTKEINDAAQQIEERVRSGQGTEGLQPETPKTEKSSSQITPFTRFAFSFGGQAVWAENELNLDIKTPLILKIIETRTDRYKKEIVQYMDNGVLGEGWNGYLALRDKTGLDLKALTQFKKLLEEENKDRKSLYEEILRANKVEINKETMTKIEAAFAQAIVVKMKAGQWYEVKLDEKKTEWREKKEEKK